MATAANNITISKYLQRPIVRQRNSVTLSQWAAYTVALPIPDPASDDWVRQRIVAEGIPMAMDSVTMQTIGYFLQDEATAENILQFISEDNDTATEETLANTNQTICGTFMPRFANQTVTANQVAAWRIQNNAVIEESSPQSGNV
jgi:hypothetical protein